MRRKSFSVTRPLPLEQSLVFKLVVAVNLNASVFRRLYSERYDMTLTDWRVLVMVVSRPGISAIEVADVLAEDKMSISRSVRRLLDRRLIRAAKNGRDRRRLSLTVAPRGAAIYAEFSPDAWEHHERFLHRLSAAERLALDGLLDKLIATGRELVVRERRDSRQPAA